MSYAAATSDICSPTSRYHAVLNVFSTKHNRRDEGSVTYLDPGRTYNLSILDSTINRDSSRLRRYRTIVGVYFGHGKHNAAHYARTRCWNSQWLMSPSGLAKSLTPAIEYAPDSHDDSGQITASCMQISDIAFDSFHLQWTSNQFTGGSYCVIPLRLNFFNTDFSLEETKSGKAMTIFVETQELVLVGSQQTSGNHSENCILDIELFVDCSAEQKFLEDCRRDSQCQDRLESLQKHHDAISPKPAVRVNDGDSHFFINSSVKSLDPMSGPASPYADEDSSIHQTLFKQDVTVQQRLEFVRPVSVFIHTKSQPSPQGKSWGSLKSRDPFKVVMRHKAEEEMRTRTTHHQSFAKSIPPEIGPLAILPHDRSASDGPGGRQHSTSQQSTYSKEHIVAASGFTRSDLHEQTSDVSPGIIDTDTACGDLKNQSLAATLEAQEQPDKLLDSKLSTSISDERSICFYVRLENANIAKHRAIYVKERSMRALLTGISTKLRILSESVSKIVYFNKDFIQIVVDDDVIRHLPDGQDLVVHFGTQPMPFNLAGIIPTTPSSSVPSSDHHRGLARSSIDALTAQAVDAASETESLLDLIDLEWEQGADGDDLGWEYGARKDDLFKMAPQLYTSPDWYHEPQNLQASPDVSQFNEHMMLEDATLELSGDASAVFELYNGPGKHDSTTKSTLSHKRARIGSSTSASASTSASTRSTGSGEQSAAYTVSSQTESTSPHTASHPNRSRTVVRVAQLPPERASTMREKNRIAAKKCRDARLTLNRNLAQLSQEHKTENARLKTLALALEAEAQHLTQLADEHRKCCGQVDCHSAHDADVTDQSCVKAKSLTLG